MSDLSDVSWLESLRVDRGISLAQAVRETGVSHKTIRKYEDADGCMYPHPKTLQKLADYYGVTPSQILNDMRKRARKGDAT